MGKIPAIAFAAYSGTGKTTLIEKLVAAFKARGLRLAVIKHDGHDFDIDHVGKDSWRFTQAGADITIIGSAAKTAYIEQKGRGLHALLAMAQDVDLILVEGFKNGDIPQIGVARQASGKGFTADPGRFIALVSDLETEAGLPIPHFTLNDIEGIAAFILEYCSLY